MEPLWWIPHREMKARIAHDAFQRARARSIAEYYRYRISQRTSAPLLLGAGAKRQQPPRPQLTVVVGWRVAIEFGHRQQVEVVTWGQERVCVRLPGGHGVKWYTVEDIARWNPQLWQREAVAA